MWLECEQGQEQACKEVLSPDDRPCEPREPQEKQSADLSPERDKQRWGEGEGQPDGDSRSGATVKQTPQNGCTRTDQGDLEQSPRKPPDRELQSCERQKKGQSPRRIPNHAGLDEAGADRPLQFEYRLHGIGIPTLEKQSANSPVGDEVVHVGNAGGGKPAYRQPQDDYGAEQRCGNEQWPAAVSVRIRRDHSSSFSGRRPAGAGQLSLVRGLVNGKLRTMIDENGARGEARGETDGFRAGFVAMIGLPNVGKSTLVNALVGQRLSIVTSKAQTTRQRLLAIYTDENHQAVFVDTPGLLEPRYLLQQGMREEAERAAVDADVVVYVVDVGYPRSIEHAREWGGLTGPPGVLCLNKIDRADGASIAQIRAEAEQNGSWDAIVETRATHDVGIGELRTAVLDRLPSGPALYPEDDVATAPMRFFVAELVRETCFEELGQELPYSIAIGVEEYREAEDPVFISATIFVERDSQKGMVIGRGGVMVRKIGTAARHKLEALIGSPVYLDLRVKVLRNWRKNPARLKLLGYPVPSRKA
jgi:GTP-binding protein Era